MRAEDLYVNHPMGEWFPGYAKEDMKVLDAFTREDALPTQGFVTDFMGCKTRTSILYSEARVYNNKVWGPPVPGAIFEAAEWIGLLKSVLTAKDSYTAMELGAGWGPALVWGAYAARTRGISNISLCGVEADPGRFALMQQHMRDNELDPAEHELIMAAVGSHAGKARWPKIWDAPNAGGGRPVRQGNQSDAKYMPLGDDAIEVDVVAFSDLIGKRAAWDLVHIDVQGWEFELCQSACRELNERVRWLVIGTHSRKIDGDLIALMFGERWVLENEKPTVFDYDASLSVLEGMTKIDGIQVWRNPRLDAPVNAGLNGEKAGPKHCFRRIDLGGVLGPPNPHPIPAKNNGHSNAGTPVQVAPSIGTTHAPRNVRLLREKVFGRPWFHRIDLGCGIVTPGVDDSPMKLTHIYMPENLTGKTVLDIGAYDGFFSFEAERRGASRVVAADEWAWTHAGMADGQGFKIAREALRSRVEPRLIAVEDISPESVGMFDLVLFLGVFYHSPDPFRYLRAAASVCREMMIVETHVDGLEYERPMMIFYPGCTLNNDPTNKWGPNLLCVEALLKEAGLRKGHFFKSYHPARIVAHAFRQ